MMRFALMGASLVSLFWSAAGWLLGLLVWLAVGFLSDVMYDWGWWPIGAVLRLVALVLLAGLFFGFIALILKGCWLVWLVMRGVPRES